MERFRKSPNIVDETETPPLVAGKRSHIYLYDTGRDRGRGNWLNALQDSDMLMLVSAACYDNGEGGGGIHGPDGHIYLEIYTRKRFTHGLRGSRGRRGRRTRSRETTLVRTMKLRGPSRTHDTNDEWRDYHDRRGLEPPREIMNYYGPHYPVGGPILHWPHNAEEVGIRLYESDWSLFREDDYYGSKADRKKPVWITRGRTKRRVVQVTCFGGGRYRHRGMTLELVTVENYHPQFRDIVARTFWDLYTRFSPADIPSLEFTRQFYPSDEISSIDGSDDGAGILLYMKTSQANLAKLYITAHTQVSRHAKYFVLWKAATYNQRGQFIRHLEAPVILLPQQRFDLGTMRREPFGVDLAVQELRNDRGEHVRLNLKALGTGRFAEFIDQRARS